MSYNKGYQLSETQIRYAMENTTSNLEASRWMKVSFSCWKKYALRYIDEKSGLSLYVLHRDTGRERRHVLPAKRFSRKKPLAPWMFQPKPMKEIFQNLHPTYNLWTYQTRLIREGWIPERCTCCGFQERRESDFTIPLKMDWLDNNKRNYALENIRLLCLNCYYIHVGNPWGVQKKVKFDDITGELVAVQKSRKYLYHDIVEKGPLFDEQKEFLRRNAPEGIPLPEPLLVDESIT